MKKLPLLVLFVLASLPLLRAADPTPAPAPMKWSVVNVDFPGGTLAQLVTLLNKTPDGSLNIVAEPGDLNVQLPPFSVQNVLPGSLVAALNQFLATRGMILQQSGVGVPQGMKDVYFVRHGPTNRDNLEPLQLAPYLENYKIDDIVGAIRAAWELDPTHDGTALRLKYHAPTSILIVSGPPEATMTAVRVLASLKRADGPTAKPEPTPKAEKR